MNKKYLIERKDLVSVDTSVWAGHLFNFGHLIYELSNQYIEKIFSPKPWQISNAVEISNALNTRHEVIITFNSILVA
jgi:hypothetical protein